MTDPWLAAVYAVAFIAAGAVVAIWLFTRARSVRAEVAHEHAEQYRELAARSATAQEQVASELANLRERVSAIEKLLEDVG